ncbi:hypothetical protein D8X55_04150 [Malacoplasma penetrans]|uniref:hypothetical protein n=1 Tax=Malacoplasma penetrans TaxID=28227 RepID=UPI0010121288|nr:hypothetical protein [Malacoplasma penetrans]RXY96323.1 hypothetical protein D8X55_04150 [Malacoplasma penetrans]
MENKINKMNKYRNIHELEVQKELLKRQLNNLLFEKSELSNEDLLKINEHKKTINEIENKIQLTKKEIEELDRNNKFECSYSVVTENGKIIETYKVNGQDVSKTEYIKAIKENNLSNRKYLEGFFNKLNSNFLDNAFFREGLPFEKRSDKKLPHRKECSCHDEEKTTDLTSSLFEFFF